MAVARFIIDPLPGVDYPFSLSQWKRWKYMCSACKHLTDDLGEIQTHMYTDHPRKKKAGRPKKKVSDKLPKPTAEQRKDIRAAISEARQRKIFP